MSALRNKFVAAFFMILSAGPALAAEVDQVRAQVYEPSEVFRNAKALELTDAQREKLFAITKDMAGRIEKQRPELDKVRNQLTQALDVKAPDKAVVQRALSAVLDQEGRIKQSQMDMLIEVKSLLTADQIACLQEMRNAGPAKSPVTSSQLPACKLPGFRFPAFKLPAFKGSAVPRPQNSKGD